ncbi:MAG: hypothetical protein QY304_01960 [Candidatus Paceibacterota bacterium]|nr:MAG: hypothetical protein QY304_01960 [Candidatus Paceibacterota bacterium]
MRILLRKKIRIYTFLVFSGFFFLLPFVSYADFNSQINYQGKLTDTNNLAVPDGNYIMKFRLYTTATSATTTNIWEEIRIDSGDRITVTDGLFSVMLGSSTPLSTVNFNQTLYLGVEICGTSGLSGCDDEMSPRKILGTVPSAFEAGKLSGLNSSQFLRSDAENSTSTASTFLRITQSGAGKIAEFIGQSSASVLALLSNGNVGVGTSSPYSRFSVWGSGTGASRLFELTNNSSTTLAAFLEDGTGYFLGNIGIGTTTPGTIFSLGNTGPDTINISTTATSTFGSGIDIRTGCFAVNGVCVGGGSGVSTFLGLTDTQSSFTANRIIHTNSSGNALTDTDGFVFDGINFGIGTSSPYARLSVVGQAVAEYFTATSSNATSTFTNLRFTGNFRTPFTSNRVPFVSTDGILSESADLTYVSGKLTAEGGLEVSRNMNTYSHFGGATTNLPVSPTNDTDRLVTIKGITGTSGERRGLLTAVDFTGSSSNSGSNMAFQSIAKHSGSGALTLTTGPGGLSGGRVGLHFGSTALGTISLATGLSVWSERGSLTVNNASITEYIGLQIEESIWYLGGSGAITDYSGIRVRSPSTTGSGTMTNVYGLRIDEIVRGNNRFAIYTGGTTKSYFGGNVGIGTTTPYSKLTVWGVGTGTNRIFELVNNASTTLFSVLDNGTTHIGTATAGNIVFETSATGNVVRVGVGTSTPDADFTIVSNQPNANTYLFTIATTTGDVINRKFTVDSDGDVAIDGSLTNPADYAEAFTVVGLKTEYEPGDIVVASKLEPGKVEKSYGVYQANLVGVYSTKPGIIGTLSKSPTAYRIEETNDIPVGVMGRVPVKVSDENGPIKAGDYITSSSRLGIGMKATKPGRVVGVALEDFTPSSNGEVGKIMTFINNNTFYFGEGDLNLEKRISDLEAFVKGGNAGGFGFDYILTNFEMLGVKIQDGFAYFKNLIAEKLTVGNRENPAGITLFDTITGEPYCLSINSGVVNSAPGECQIFKSGGGSVDYPDDQVGSDNKGDFKADEIGSKEETGSEENEEKVSVGAGPENEIVEGEPETELDLEEEL